MDRADLYAEPGRRHGGVRLRRGRGAGVLGVGRAVRKLVDAAGRDPGRADVRACARWSAWRWRRMDINIFVQVGFVVLVGLASKNAILVVEFARESQKATGISAFDATVLASKTRLRPIVMTSFAFILGVVPLVVATGAGAEMRRTLGTAVFSGMLGVTAFGLLLTPVFYYVIERLRPHSAPPAGQSATPAATPKASSDGKEKDGVIAAPSHPTIANPEPAT